MICEEKKVGVLGLLFELYDLDDSCNEFSVKITILLYNFVCRQLHGMRARLRACQNYVLQQGANKAANFAV